jgi:uncharacterized protein (TIGR00288 family)
MNSNKRVMLLVDADNVSGDVIEQAVATVMATHGAIHVRRAYCTAESALKHLTLFKRLSIRPMVNLSAGKNSTDIALAVDGLDLVMAERPDVVVIVSSDSDFAPLVIRLREKGCRVEGIGQQGKTGGETEEVYDDFVDLAHRKTRAAPRAPAKRGTRTAAAPAPPPAPAPRAAAAPTPRAATPTTHRAAAPAPRAAAPAPARHAPPRLPDAVADILDAVPELREGGWVELGPAAEQLRQAKLLSKSASSAKLFKKHEAHFALKPEKNPNKVQFAGARR